MDAYDSVIDLLNHQGPGLADYVTPAELDELVDGVMAPALIADRYLAELDASTVVLATDAAATRADLLAWIRWEIEISIHQREDAERDVVMLDTMAVLKATVEAEKRFAVRNHEEKLRLARQALNEGATKNFVADVLEISRPTLNKWLATSQ